MTPPPSTTTPSPTSCPTTTTKTSSSSSSPKSCTSVWPYSPSFPLAITFTTLFSLLALTHLLLALLHRKPFCWVIIMASTWESASFILRSLGTQHLTDTSILTASQILFLLAPLWINAFVYMTAGRLIYAFHPAKRVWGVDAVKMGTWFVWLDVFSFVVQGAGGSMLDSSYGQDTVGVGMKIYMTGVGVQEVCILVFGALVAKFHVDVKMIERQGELVNHPGGKRWEWVTYSLYAVLALITMRIAFRLAEFSSGLDEATNDLPYKEGYALGLDALPMVLAILVLAIVHPGMVLKGEGSEFPSRKVRKAEKTAKKAEKKETSRARKEESLMWT